VSNRTQTLERKVEVKLALADKYDRLALLTGSRPRRRTYVTRAERYRRQAAVMRSLEK
jgi:hypothetical protein